METTITATELAEELSEVLNRVREKRERFIVQRDGETIARIVPTSGPRGITVEELIAKVGNLKMPGDGFAEDLEAIQAEQGVAEFPEWPD